MINRMYAFDKMFMLPFIFSTFTSAISEMGMEKDIEDECVTIFAPNNQAWKQMHMQDLIYLFSPCGHKDLKKILQFHIVPELNYARDIMDTKECKMPTLLKDEKLCIRATERKHKSSSSQRGMEDESPNKFIFCINNGEATMNYTDCVAKNGTIHSITNVLIPRDVELPSMREMKDRESRRNRDGRERGESRNRDRRDRRERDERRNRH